MSQKTLHLLHLAAIALFLYFLALTARVGGAVVAFAIFLPAGMIAELMFWVRLFRRGD